MRAAMYHYVRPSTDRPPGGYYRLDAADFRAQLDVLESRYDVLGRDRLLAVLRGERAPPDDGLVLTFDDGLVDHREWVLPELRERGLCGVFFVPTGPLDGLALPVHRVHALLGRLDAERVDEALGAVVAERGLERAGSSADTYGGDDGEQASAALDAAGRVKRLVNFELPWGAVPGVLDAVEGRLSAAPLDPASYYCSAADLRALDDAGMLLGAHTVSHPVLSRLPEADQRAEIRDSFDRLAAVVGGLDARLFAYPFGGPETFTGTTASLLADAGCDAAFTTVSDRIDAATLADRPLALPRRDCNEFPHGAASFEM
jgi:peptidoglycan/xylan/chitin deacetylase (PgdA/CDA1 family)